MAITLSKVQEQAPDLVNLVKSAQVSLEKRKLPVDKAQVTLVLDFSGSMHGRYNSGEVQRLAERVLALATQLDDDGAIDVFIFENRTTYLGQVTLADYKGSVDRLTNGRYMGGTDYASAFESVFRHFGFTSKPTKGGLFRKSKPAALTASAPVYALFLTDGDPQNKQEAERVLTEVSAAPIFWKMISVGSSPIGFLQKLDDLDSRTQDNADYKHVRDVDGIPDNELFDMLLEEYPEFLTSSKNLGMIS